MPEKVLARSTTNEKDKEFILIDQEEKLVDPFVIKSHYYRLGLNKEYKSMYTLICWICEDTVELGLNRISFD